MTARGRVPCAPRPSDRSSPDRPFGGVALRHRQRPAEIEAELARIGHTRRPLEIVVADTRAGSRYGETGYIDNGCGFGRAATLWLTEHGIRVVGTDGWSWAAHHRKPTPLPVRT
jgi:kynurenine formamidase